jgi:hypothetical protein
MEAVLAFRGHARLLDLVGCAHKGNSSDRHRHRQPAHTLIQFTSDCGAKPLGLQGMASGLSDDTTLNAQC